MGMTCCALLSKVANAEPTPPPTMSEGANTPPVVPEPSESTSAQNFANDTPSNCVAVSRSLSMSRMVS